MRGIAGWKAPARSFAHSTLVSRLTVAIVGGGASGALLATELVRRSPHVRAVVIDPAERLGLGMAYATRCPAHLLNVPASRMSALADDPGHFTAWLAERYAGTYGPRSFVPRTVYGEYLVDVVEAARRDAGDRFEHVRASALALASAESGPAVACSGGVTVRGDVLVVASGNSLPARWPGFDAEDAGHGAFFASAWAPQALIPADPAETVLILGTGLTAVDAILGLRHAGHRGVIFMVSRRGLIPNEHRFFDAPPPAAPEAQTMTDLFAAVRSAARESFAGSLDWRVAVDSLRPRTNALWQALTLEEQRRFVRHAMPYWNVHRHRMAPEVAAALADLTATGRLLMLAGTTRSVVANGGRFDIGIDLRGGRGRVQLEVDRVINCSGPEHDVRRLDNPLLADLLAQGLLVPHALGIGVDVAPDGALRGRDGVPSNRIYTLGPIRYGTLIETTAIPEIRDQVRELASLLLERAGEDGAFTATVERF